jgi:hypothetical protein
LPDIQLLKDYGPYAAFLDLAIRELVRYFRSRADDFEDKIFDRATKYIG